MSDPAESGPGLDHVARPVPPWRIAAPLTACGLETDGRPVLTRDEFVAKVKTQGQQRSAMTTCMTCWNTARRWPTWEQDPVAALGREAARYRYESGLFRDELIALAELAARHREEFEAIVAGLAKTVRLDERRRSRRRN